MSAVLQIKGDMMAQLSKMVKMAAESQIDTIMELSKELSKHNKLVDKALERQERMIQKIDRIEQKLKEKDGFDYKSKQMALERKRQLEDQIKLEKEQKAKSSSKQSHSNRKNKGNQHLLMDYSEEQKDNSTSNSYQTMDDDDDDEGFASCEDDEQEEEAPKIEKYSFWYGHEIEADAYFENFLKSIQGEDNKNYLREGRACMLETMKWLDVSKGWTYQKDANDCKIYFRDACKKFVNYRVDTVLKGFDTRKVASYFTNVDDFLKWSGQDTEKLEQLQTCTDMCSIVYSKMKEKWPIGGRDAVCNMYGYWDSNDRFYMVTKSTKHPKYPDGANKKITRMEILGAILYLEPCNGGKDTKFTYILEFDFKGSLPLSLIRKFAPTPYTENLRNLKKLMSDPDNYVVGKMY